MSEPLLSTPLDDLLLPTDALPPKTIDLMEALVRSLRAEQATSPVLTAERLAFIRAYVERSGEGEVQRDVIGLLDHIDYLTDAYEQIVRRSAEEADRAQSLVLRKEEELAAHDDLHRAAARRIEHLLMDEIRLDYLLAELRDGRMPRLPTFTRRAIDRALDEATKPATTTAPGASL